MYFRIMPNGIFFKFGVEKAPSKYGPWRYLKGFDSLNEAEQYILELKDERIGKLY